MTREEKLYNTLLDHARTGAPFPSKQAMANATGIPEGSVQMVLDRLCQNGDIRIETQPMGSRKRALIVGTTSRTGWSVSNRGTKKHYVKAEPNGYAPEDIASLAVNRDPCFYCGVRADHVPPCPHRRAVA